ncbi:unnamed protein product [Caenorhabditis bovis]|uniref:EGF-like domain-containing protein n=1 Tax=Caenorhabditis bovis TaxID=2654633 RepID=A0A8S1EC37_9PELO|nr:unnamed protein product [Caenorhabditis bovis]
MRKRCTFQSFCLVAFAFWQTAQALFLRVETGHQNIAIDGRDVYYGHFTKIFFHNLTCINAIDIHCLKELTGAEEIDLLYSECPKGHWKVAHYTNSKHHFWLKEPINAIRLLISSRWDLSIIDAQVESCNSNLTSHNCRHLSNGHNHRHGKTGGVIHAIDSSFMDPPYYTRTKRSISQNDEIIDSGIHNIEEPRVVGAGKVLTIVSGAKLHFSKNSGITVHGRLIVKGSRNQPVIMDGEDWKGIEFVDADFGSIISYANISGSAIGVHVDRGNAPALEHVILDRNSYGVKYNDLKDSSVAKLFKVTVVNNEKNGIEYLGKGSISLDNCVAASNGGLGIFINTNSTIIIRDAFVYSNNGTGVYVGTGPITIENTAVSSNGFYGIHAEVERSIEFSNVNISAQFNNFGVEILTKNSSHVTVMNSHVHDNKIGALRIRGYPKNVSVHIHNTNFTRNTGSTVFFKAEAESSYLYVSKCWFLNNNFKDYDAKDAVLFIEKGESVHVAESYFVKNTMHDTVHIENSDASIIGNMFMQNLGNSAILANSKFVNITGNLFSDKKSTCEVTFGNLDDSAILEMLDNDFGKRENWLCTNKNNSYDRYHNDMPQRSTSTDHPNLEYLPDPFIDDSTFIKSSEKPYRIKEEVIVADNETIVVEPGTILDFAPGTGITVHGGGRLILNGTEEAPIVIRGQNGNTWRGLVTKPFGALEMNNVVMEDPSVGVWIDSDQVTVNNGRIVRPTVHGIEIAHNSDDVVDLGGILIEEAHDAAIGVDERRDDLKIRNFVIQNSAGSGVDFVTPTGNIEISDARISNIGSYAIHLAEFPSTPLHAVLISNVTVENQERGQAGILISGGWVQNIGLHQLKFTNNLVPSLIVALECNDFNERLLRIENSTFSENHNVVQHFNLANCVNLQMEKNSYLSNNEDGVGSTVVISSENSAIKKNAIMQISANDFYKNHGTYSLNVDSKAHELFLTDNLFEENENSGSVVKVISANAKILTNQFSSPGSKFQLAVSPGSDDNEIVDATNNDWGSVESEQIFQYLDAPEGSVQVFPIWSANQSLQLDSPTTMEPVTIPISANFGCAHLNHCSSRGTCKDGICICPIGFAGFDCSLPMFCNCSGNGLCDLFNKCICNLGWSGTDCSKPICSNNCNSNGKCVAPNQCDCNPGWTGSSCGITTCVDSSCVHGHCHKGVCLCEQGWQGSKCQIPVCGDCSLNGICVEPNRCSCFEGYSGNGCAQCVEDSCSECDFECDHGYCEPITRTCSCSAGWSGGACDVCLSAKCTYTSRIDYIEPSTAEIDNTNTVVSVYGSEFPKTPNNSYICTYGKTSVTGIRISSSLIRCPVPANMTLGRHVFSVSQPGSFQSISSVRPIHFTWHDGCDPSVCQGSCVGPLCICPQGKTGVFCDVIEVIPVIDRRFLEHQRANRAFEGTPYVVMLPTMTSSVLRVNSNIPNYNFIASKGIIAWPEPIGSHDPYTINVTAFSPAGESSIAWNVTVDPTYSSEVLNVTIDGTHARILGRVVGDSVKQKPVVIRIRRQNFIDEIIAETDDSGIIEYEYVPESSGTYSVGISHPNSNETSNTIEFTIPNLNLPIIGDSTRTTLKIEVKGAEKCEATLLEPRAQNPSPIKGGSDLLLEFEKEWDGQVLAKIQCDQRPPEIVRAPPVEVRQTRSNPDKLVIIYQNGIETFHEIVLKIPIEALNPIKIEISSDSLELLSSDPNIEDFVEKKPETLKLFFATTGLSHINGSIAVKSDDQVLITIPYYFIQFSENTYYTFKICLRDEWDGQEEVDFNEVATIALRNIQRNIDITRSNIRLNIQWADFTIPPGIYELQVKSDRHENFVQVLELDPMNTTFCITLKSMQDGAVPSLQCHRDESECKPKMSALSSTEQPLPYLQFEPSIITKKGQKTLVTARGNLAGSIGLWNTEDDQFQVLHSRRTVNVNESFWTTVIWNEELNENCATQIVNVPFVFLPENSNLPIHVSSQLLAKASMMAENSICDQEGLIEPAMITEVMCNCGDGARTRCRSEYKPATACGASWAKIADDTISLEVLASFLSMLFECKEVSVDFNEIRQSLECVASIESECPIANLPRIKRQINDAPVKILSSVNLDLGKVLPVLNVLDVQTIRISTVFIEFIDKLLSVFPSSLYQDMTSEDIENFIKSIADNSPQGNHISGEEMAALGANGERLAQLWNDTVKYWKSGNMLAKRQGIQYEAVRDLVQATDRVKSLTRQNVAQDPFAMLHGYMERTLETGESQQNKCATTNVYIEQTEVEEDNQVRIRVFIENQSNMSLFNIGVSLSFVKKDSSTPNVDFNVGPSWSAGIGSLTGLGTIDSKGSFEIHWTRLVTSSRRLSSVAIYQPIIVFAFSSNGKQTQQRLNAPELRIIPKKTVKAINIIKDGKSPKDGVDFSIISSIINPGYSTLENVRIKFDNIVSKQRAELHSVFINGKEQEFPTISPNFTSIPSGSTQLVRFILADGDQTATVESINITCIENGRLLPLESAETYAIRAAGPSDYGMLLAIPDQDVPLFYFKPAAAQMTNVIKLEFLSTQISNSSDPQKLIVHAAFRNMESKSFNGALWAEMPVPEVSGKRKLTSIVDRSGPRPRELQAVQWETEENGTPMLNWIDSSGSTNQQVITYALQFTIPTNEREGPSFEQTNYRIEIPPHLQIRPSTVIGQLAAEGDDLSYALYTPDNERRFSVEPQSGKIFYEAETPLESEEFCAVLEAKDAYGRVARVPLAINNGGLRVDCVLFSTEELTPHLHSLATIPTPIIFTIATTAPIETTTSSDEYTTSNERSTSPIPWISRITQPTTLTFPDSTPAIITSTASEGTTTEAYEQTTEGFTISESTTDWTMTSQISTTTTVGDEYTTSEGVMTYETTALNSNSPTTNADYMTSTTDSEDYDFSTTEEPLTSTDVTLKFLTTTEKVVVLPTDSNIPETSSIISTTEDSSSTTTTTPYFITSDSSPVEHSTSEIPVTTEAVYTMTSDPILHEYSTNTPMIESTTGSVSETVTTEPHSTISSDSTHSQSKTTTHMPDETTSEIETTTSDVLQTIGTDGSLVSVYPTAATTNHPILSTLSPEDVQKQACALSSSMSIYKIICDISTIAKPTK